MKHSVLLADDDPALRRLIGTTLGDQDFDLLQAVDGDEALDIARRRHPALVLLDVNMPKLDGLQLIERGIAERERQAVKGACDQDACPHLRPALRDATASPAERYSGEQSVISRSSGLDSSRFD